MDLARVDLTLLVVFDALMHEQHVTRAGERIGLTQSATSGALARLRDLFGDELFVRTAAGMQPTPRAQQLAGPVRDILERIRRLGTDQFAFDPKEAVGRFTVGMSDYVALLLLPRLAARLAVEAPGIELVARPVEQRSVYEMLDAGSLDMAIDFCSMPPPWAQAERFFEDRFVCVVAADSTFADRRIALEDYLAAPHVMVSIGHPAPSSVDTALADRGLRRRVAITVPSFLLVPHIVMRSGMIATLPLGVAEMLAETLPISLIDPPLPIAPIPADLIWHRKHARDPAHLWLRSLMTDVIGSKMSAKKKNGARTREGRRATA